MFYFNLFFVFSIVGFLFETILSFLFGKGYDSGILYGPWTPVYGIGVLVMFLVNKFLKKRNLHPLYEKIMFFILVTTIVTVFEFIGGYLIELIFGQVYWSYDWAKFKIGKYVCLEVSLLWGVMSLLVNYLLLPKVKKLIEKIPKKLTIVLIVAFILDIIFKIVFAIF